MTIMASVHETTNTIEKGVRAEIKSARHGLATANERAIHYVKTNPGKCLLAALAVGFIVGRIAGR
jgi:hypothetical protein